jgi:hypothetical protein
MRRLVALWFVVCAIQLPLLAQSVFHFSIDFPATPLPPAIGVPGGNAELSGSSFTPWVFLGTSAADYGRIFEMADNSSLTPVFQFTSVLVDSYPPTPGFPGSGGTFYSYFETWDLTALQAQSLLAGRWYMELAFGTQTHFAQITPVPEPTSAALFVSGVALVAACCRRRFLGLPEGGFIQSVQQIDGWRDLPPNHLRPHPTQ